MIFGNYKNQLIYRNAIQYLIIKNKIDFDKIAMVSLGSTSGIYLRNIIGMFQA